MYYRASIRNYSLQNISDKINLEGNLGRFISYTKNFCIINQILPSINSVPQSFTHVEILYDVILLSYFIKGKILIDNIYHLKHWVVPCTFSV